MPEGTKEIGSGCSLHRSFVVPARLREASLFSYSVDILRKRDCCLLSVEQEYSSRNSTSVTLLFPFRLHPTKINTFVAL